MNGEMALKFKPTSTPAIPASAEATPNVTRMTVSTLMPRMLATWMFSDVARMAMP